MAEGADAERVITQLAENGMDMIFTTSFGYMNPTVKVAAKFPDIRFEHATEVRQYGVGPAVPALPAGR